MVKGKKKRGGAEIKLNWKMGEIFCEDGSKYYFLGSLNGSIIELNIILFFKI